jgi:hypothetical protein
MNQPQSYHSKQPPDVAQPKYLHQSPPSRKKEKLSFGVLPSTIWISKKFLRVKRKKKKKKIMIKYQSLRVSKNFKEMKNLRRKPSTTRNGLTTLLKKISIQKKFHLIS